MLFNHSNLSNNIEIIYTKNISRPSKSLVNPVKFTEFNNCIKSYYTSSDLIVSECINYTKEKYILVDSQESEFDYILVDINNINLIFNEICNCKHGHNIVVKLSDLYNYPKIQVISILNFLFESIEIIFSQFYNCCCIFCTNKINNVEKCKPKSIIKDFSIRVSDELTNIIYDYNMRYINKIIDMNNKINKLDVNNTYKEITLLNEYINNYINKIFKTCNCKELVKSNLLECMVCKECYALHSFEDFALDQAAEADLNASL